MRYLLVYETQRLQTACAAYQNTNHVRTRSVFRKPWKSHHDADFNNLKRRRITKVDIKIMQRVGPFSARLVTPFHLCLISLCISTPKPPPPPTSAHHNNTVSQHSHSANALFHTALAWYEKSDRFNGFSFLKPVIELVADILHTFSSNVSSINYATLAITLLPAS